jgi:hypothetical protein
MGLHGPLQGQLYLLIIPEYDLRFILGKWDGAVWTGFIFSVQRPVAGSYEHGYEPSGYIKYWEILESRSCWWLLKKGLAPRSYELRFSQR